MMDFFKPEDRAVSPVIGVILMVAITVILAAVIGAFVLGLGDGIGQNPQAAVTFSDGPGDNQITVTVSSVQAADLITVGGDGDIVDGESETIENPSAGEQRTIDAGSGSGTIVVTAELDGQTSVIANHDYDHGGD